MNRDKLLEAAHNARKKAYAPYSGFCVGAALLTKGQKIYTGCNIENAAYTPTNCAERTAFFKAVSEGEREFSAIAVVGGKECDFKDYFTPCGVCRQVMMEFCEKDFRILIGKNGEEYLDLTLDEILPYGFSPKHLG